MGSVLIPVILGILILMLGVMNRKGNISSIHWYHRQRVSEENRIPFGKTIGLGTVIIGVSIIIFGILSFAAELLKMEFLVVVGSVIVVAGIIVGLALSLYAMMKYNRGIF